MRSDYGPGHGRVKKTAIVAGQSPNTGTTVVTYVGGQYEKIAKPDGSIEEKFYIYSPSGLTAVKTKLSTTAKIEYPLLDNLGSVHLATDESGTVVEAGTFSAYGSHH